MDNKLSIIKSDQKLLINYNEIINNFILLKNISSNMDLDDKTIKLLDDLFGNSINKKERKIKKNNNILKNNKIQQKKDNISNKINLILNKLSENNINNLLIEFIDTIGQVDNETFDEILKIFYLKIINEINFIKIYLDFLKLIIYIYKKIQNYNLEFFYNIIEIKFKIDYDCLDKKLLVNKYYFMNELNNENNKLNNLSLIKYLIDNKFLGDDLLIYCNNIILNQNLYLSDIYYWYSHKNNYKLSDSEIIKIKTIISQENINARDKILLESLINIKNNILISNDNESNNITKNITNLEINNLLDNYYNFIINKNILFNNATYDIEEYINKICIDSIMKNIFCEIIFHYYLIKDLNDNEINLFNELIEYLINSQILLKSNITKGLLLNNTNWDNKIEYYYNIDSKMKILLNNINKLGISKNIEFIIEKYI